MHQKAVCSGCFTITEVKTGKMPMQKPGNPGKVGTVLIAGVSEPMDGWGYNFFFGGSATNPSVFYPNIVDSNIKWTDYSKPAVDGNYGVYKVYEETWASTGAMCWFLNNCSDVDLYGGRTLKRWNFIPHSFRELPL